MTRKAKKTRKSKFIRLRFRKGDPAHNLIAAAQHWIHANGGTAIVLGSIGIMDEGGGRYQVCLGALGKVPKKKEKS